MKNWQKIPKNQVCDSSSRGCNLSIKTFEMNVFENSQTFSYIYKATTHMNDMH